MVKYWVKTPSWLKKLSPKEMLWDMPACAEPTVYITFDDGPHPTATPFVLEQLEKYNAAATFFCVGNNVIRYPDVYEKVLKGDHATGNHTFDHINGWKTPDELYLENIEQARQHIVSKLFRPPYGRMKNSQVKKLLKNDPNWKICMWDVLSGDFDKEISPRQCLDNVLKHIRPGSIVLFHDSEKAWERMSYALPAVLAHCQERKWKMKGLI
jgi:peptidoglycan/xylan/chitin deacetylase (PgdA/CDA1 family)